MSLGFYEFHLVTIVMPPFSSNFINFSILFWLIWLKYCLSFQRNNSLFHWFFVISLCEETWHFYADCKASCWTFLLCGCMFHLYCFLTHLLAFSEHHRLPTPGLGLDTFAYLCPLGGNGYFLTINSSYPSFTVQYFEFGSLSVINVWRSRVALLFRVSFGVLCCAFYIC